MAMMKETTRGGRNGRATSPARLTLMPESRGMWHEDAPAIRRALRWGRRKERLLRWVRVQMVLVLTRRERECLELYFFRSLSLRQIGLLTHTNASSVHRAVHRAIRKLRQATHDDTTWR
jgi:DNA-directed RNA polymerase specialized sigma24 family protein